MGGRETNKTKKQRIEKQSDSFDDLITKEILTRLPAKSILRFKSVSKRWYSTLSSSNFANAHLIKSPFSHPSAPVNTLFIKSGKSYYLFSYKDDNDDQISGSLDYNFVKLDIEFDVESEDNFKLAGCCNGLVCLTQVGKFSGTYFLVWNPITRKIHKYELNEYIKHFEKPYYPFIVSGFGYVSSVDDYKYVRISCMVRDYGNPNCIAGVHVFSLKEKKWKKIDCDIEVYVLIGRAVLIDEKLYWSAISFEFGKVIVSFDLGTEKFDIFPYLSEEQQPILILGSMGEFLCKFDYNRLVYLLKPPAIMKSSISLPDNLCFNASAEMVGYTKTGKIFMTGGFTHKLQNRSTVLSMLALVDPASTKRMQYTMLLKSEGSINIARYVPSLVSPFPTST